MSKNNRMLIIVVSLFLLPYFHVVSQAQDELRWRAVSIAISNNGRYLAVKHGISQWINDVRHYENGVWIYDLENLLLPPHYLSEAQEYHSWLKYSPNSEYLAVGGYRRLTIFETENNDVILDLPSSATPIPSDFRWFTFSPDSKHIMTFSDLWSPEHEMSIWDIDTGQRVHAVATSIFPQQVGPLWLSPDWHQFFSWTTSLTELETIYQFDIERGVGQPLGTTFTGNEVGALFSPDSSFFALATWEGEVQVYETDTWTMKNSISLHQSPCGESGVALAFAHKQPWLAATCTWEGTLSVWDYQINQLVFRDDSFLTGEPEFTLDDSFLITSRAYSDSPERFAISVWNIENDFDLVNYPGVSPQLHPSSEIMAAIGPDNKIWIWNIKQDQLLVILPVPQN